MYREKNEKSVKHYLYECILFIVRLFLVNKKRKSLSIKRASGLLFIFEIITLLNYLSYRIKMFHLYYKMFN